MAAIERLLTQDYQTSSGVPKYLQIREAIRRLIENGHFREDQMLPPEREFCEMFGVSRMTVRHAVDALVREGMLERRTGNGTFVRSIKLTGRSRGHYGFSDELALAGKTTHTEVLEKRVVPAPDHVAEKLRLTDGERETVRIKRLRFVDEHPISHETSYLPYDLSVQVMEEDLSGAHSLYHYLTETLGIDVCDGHETIQAVGAEEKFSEWLRVPVGTPCFLVRRVLLAREESRPVEYVETLLRGDKFMFVNRLEEKGS